MNTHESDNHIDMTKTRLGEKYDVTPLLMG